MPGTTPNKGTKGSPDRLVAFERLKTELGAAFAAPDDTYELLSASDVVTRNRARRIS
jgi:hypothetical protein